MSKKGYEVPFLYTMMGLIEISGENVTCREDVVKAAKEKLENMSLSEMEEKASYLKDSETVDNNGILDSSTGRLVFIDEDEDKKCKNVENINYWIIGKGGTDCDDVDTHLVLGTKEQVKNHLINVIKDDIDVHIEYNDDFEYGTENVDELESFNCETKFYGSVTFSNSHVDYTATLAQSNYYCLTESTSEI
jgi:hypothetical protein